MRKITILLLLVINLFASLGGDIDQVRALLAKGQLNQADSLLQTMSEDGEQLALRAYIHGEAIGWDRCCSKCYKPTQDNIN